MEFHNVWEFEQVDGLPGRWLHRYPAGVRRAPEMNEGARHVSQNSCGAEIRFVCDDAKFIRISVSAVESNTQMFVFFGNYLHEVHELEAGKITSPMITRPQNFQYVEDDFLEQSGHFSPRVWRFVFFSGYVCFHHLESFGHAVRPPAEGEKPPRRWLAYGSSITMGSRARAYCNNYVNLSARALGVDALNLGLAGSCHLEKEIADFIADRGDWDFATLELGVNVRGLLSPEVFRERAEYLVNTVIAKNPDKPVVLITIFPNTATHSKDKQPDDVEILFNEILRDIAATSSSENLHLIEGSDMLTRFEGLSTDLIHPSDFGFMEMADNLCRMLREKGIVA